ncbi:PHP domain-containing protein [Teichococcus aestuarii]|uniref:hypothetical protein n=1 Tax=Teichococcus aestuarii TaxID=568898 RepID=UPI00361523A8
MVRGHVAAREAGLPFRVGARLALEDGSEFLAWPTDRGGYGRLTTLLSRGRLRAPKGECQIGLEEMLAHAAGWCTAAIPPHQPDAAFARRFAGLAERLWPLLALPLFCAAACRMDGQDRARLAGWPSWPRRPATVPRCWPGTMCATTTAGAAPWPTCSPPSASAAPWRRWAGTPSRMPSAGSSGPATWRGCSPAIRRR